VLQKLVDDRFCFVRNNVASNINTPPALLQQLADGSLHERFYVATNINTPPAALQQLAGDQNKDVRRHVAGNINTPLDALAVLVLDINPDVQKAALKTFKRCNKQGSNTRNNAPKGNLYETQQ
jgi:hypothetical protein